METAGGDDEHRSAEEDAVSADERTAEGGRGQAEPGAHSAGEGPAEEGGEGAELPAGGWGPSPAVGASFRAPTPLFAAQHADRYARRLLIQEYERLTGARLIVMIDAIFDTGVTLLEELLVDADPDQPLHLMLASPGGDGEVAIRLVKALQASCSHLTIVVPDMAKSASTLMCLGADTIIMGPASDLGPVDPQFSLPDRGGLVSAREIQRAVRDAESRVAEQPETLELYASLLADVNMLMVEQATSALERTEVLIREALGEFRQSKHSTR